MTNGVGRRAIAQAVSGVWAILIMALLAAGWWPIAIAIAAAGIASLFWVRRVIVNRRLDKAAARAAAAAAADSEHTDRPSDQ